MPSFIAMASAVLKPMPRISRQPVWVFGYDLDGVRTIGLEDPHRPRRADTVAMQEDHNFPDCLLLGPGSENVGSANWSNAVDLTKPIRCRLDDVEHLVGKGAHQLLPW